MRSSGIALVVLAGGASRRLGEPKALVRLHPDAGTVLEELLAAGAELSGARPLVVAGPHSARISEAASAIEQPFDLVENACWEEGRTSSVRCAVARRPGLDLCLAPVDVPRVPASVFAALARTWWLHDAPPRGWLAPWIASPTGPRFGHPVVLGRELAGELKEFPAGRSLRELRALAAPLLAVEVTSRAILEDLDTAADLERLRLEEARERSQVEGKNHSAALQARKRRKR